MPEIWKDVFGFEGIYQISDAGNLRSLDRTVKNKGSGGCYKLKGQPLKPRKDADGYLITDLWKKGKKTTVKVHRLTARAFIEGSGAEVDHINGIRGDNRAVNLRWASISQNRTNTHTRKNKSGVTGVRFTEGAKNPWQAYGRINGKYKSLGSFPTKPLAVLARERHLQEVFSA